MKEKKLYRWSFKDLELVFWWGVRFQFTFEICDYFDNRPVISLCPGPFTFKIHLPFRNKWTDECDPPEWGIAIHNNTFWLYKGGNGNDSGGNKWWTFNMPWSYEWVRTSNLRKDGTWEHETKGNRKDFWKDEWKEVIQNDTYPYTYVLKSGKIQEREATIKTEEREWRWKWFTWSPWPRFIRREIQVEFNDEVGEKTGEWKGGTLGCGYDLLPGETPLECLRRMERERKFT